ncbi:MAG: hypothetical protein ACI89L_000394 [Phycisphaerales bacterium]|jgi:hypothetical protein
MSDGEQPKIIIDDDWKSQAQAEKEKLAEQGAQEKAKAQSMAEGGDGPFGDDLGFDDLVKMMATQALMYLGAIPDPNTGKAMLAPEYAKLHIDMLGVIEEKTRGNLSDDEKAMLAGTLQELRMQFVEIMKVIQQARAEGKLEELMGGGAEPAPAPVS